MPETSEGLYARGKVFKVSDPNLTYAFSVATALSR